MDLNTITEDTLAQFQDFMKSATAGVIGSTGLVGFDLGPVVSLVPVNTPTYDTVAREDGSGSVAANWKALLNVNSTQPNPFTGIDGGGTLINISEQDMLAKYLPVRVSGKVTRDAVAFAKNYEDAKGIASIQTLMQWRIQDNKAIIGGQAWALGTIGTVTCTTATTGGTIAATTAIHVKVSARSSFNYFWGSGAGAAGGGIASSDATVTSGGGTATNTVTATWAAIKGAVAYDVWVGPSSGTYFYYTTVTAPTALITLLPVANQALPLTLPGLFGTAPTAVPYAADTTSNANSYNGIYASVLGDYSSSGLVTPGSGTSSGATWTDLGGAALTSSAQGVAQIDNMNSSIYNTAQLSPTRIRANARVMQEIGSAAMGTNSAVTYLQPDGQERTGLTVGMNVARYINRITGETQTLIVDPWMPDGSAVFEAESIPYPNAGIANTFAVRTLQEVAQFDYGVSLVAGANGGPAEVWDQSSIETLICRAPMACGVLTGIG